MELTRYSVGVTDPIFETDGTSITMKMGIPDDLIGVIIGKAGATIKEIAAMSGTFAVTSQKGDVLPGTMVRYVKVTGTQHQVQIALDSIVARLKYHKR